MCAATLWRMAQNCETKIQNQILLALSQAGALVWRNQVGVFRAMDDPSRVVKVGTPGMADIIGVVPVTITPDMVGKTVGVAIAPEIKTATGTQQHRQRLWQLAFEKRGGIYLITRSPEQATQQLASILERIARG